MENNFNRVQLCGVVDQVLSETRVIVDVERKSGNHDYIPVEIDDATVYNKNDAILVEGKLKSETVTDETGIRHLDTFVKGTDLSVLGEPRNFVGFTAYICKQPMLRETPKGKTICDYCVAIQDAKNNTSYYVYCISFGDAATYVADLKVGAKIMAKGYFQSRAYTKYGLLKHCYEVVINNIKEIQDEQD